MNAAAIDYQIKILVKGFTSPLVSVRNRCDGVIGVARAIACKGDRVVVLNYCDSLHHLEMFGHLLYAINFAVA